MFFNKNPLEERIRLASSPLNELVTKPEVVEELARDGDDYVRFCLASNPRLGRISPKAHRMLENDPNPEVRAELRRTDVENYEP